MKKNENNWFFHIYIMKLYCMLFCYFIYIVIINTLWIKIQLRVLILDYYVMMWSCKLIYVIHVLNRFEGKQHMTTYHPKTERKLLVRFDLLFDFCVNPYQTKLMPIYFFFYLIILTTNVRSIFKLFIISKTHWSRFINPFYNLFYNFKRLCNHKLLDLFCLDNIFKLRVSLSICWFPKIWSNFSFGPKFSFLIYQIINIWL